MEMHGGTACSSGCGGCGRCCQEASVTEPPQIYDNTVISYAHAVSSFITAKEFELADNALSYLIEDCLPHVTPEMIRAINAEGEDVLEGLALFLEEHNVNDQYTEAIQAIHKVTRNEKSRA